MKCFFEVKTKRKNDIVVYKRRLLFAKQTFCRALDIFPVGHKTAKRELEILKIVHTW